MNHGMRWHGVPDLKLFDRVVNAAIWISQSVECHLSITRAHRFVQRKDGGRVFGIFFGDVIDAINSRLGLSNGARSPSSGSGLNEVSVV